ncbi:HAD-IB family hydrolase [Legionella erythra]|uniref:Haloacid dehalogenase-like hydrolase n=1 Tax=Legionella erythra TaxID=448 RepID=A0A0W0TQN7_LEGER|nr:HAD-IB family hydrolase [Legionella erythra]KTC97830.1 haloacid dehalogenase-like hydrolase [Legionella erythra]
MSDQLDDGRPVAIFDFDGTITRKSTTLPFLRFVFGASLFTKLTCQLHSLLLYSLNRMDLDALNQIIAQSFFKHLTRDFLFEQGARFSDQVLPSLIRDSAHQRITWHKSQGHYCILATAAYDLYMTHWSMHHAFDGVASTRIAFDELGRATGALQGKSCYGEEKLQRVLTLIGDTPRTVYAYGDSAGDKAILDYATHPYYKYFK